MLFAVTVGATDGLAWSAARTLIVSTAMESELSASKYIFPSLRFTCLGV
jgi:hypothetical protein